jgi:hypothetical protein
MGQPKPNSQKFITYGRARTLFLQLKKLEETDDHAGLNNLYWLVSGHTGGINALNRLAAFAPDGSTFLLSIGNDVVINGVASKAIVDTFGNGLCPQLSGNPAQVLHGDGTWS